jgi:tetratricopeptide (TPR) repeat protein
MENEARKFCDLGKEFLDRGEPEEALRCYERAIDVDPEYPDAWCGRGKAAYDLGRLERADRDFRRALRLAARTLGDPKGAHRWWADVRTRPYLRALHGHGLCGFWLGRYEDAAKTFEKLLRLAPTDPLDVRFLVGETYLRMGRIERAVQELAKIDDDPDALYNLGLATFYAGDFPTSVNAFRRAIFANLHLPEILAEIPRKKDGDEDEGANREGRSRPEEIPSDSGASPKGLDSEAAANDYADRCGDYWFGRPVVQKWLYGIRKHPVVEADVKTHLEHLQALVDESLPAGDRARVEGKNTALRSPERLAKDDRKIASEVLADVFVLPKPKES